MPRKRVPVVGTRGLHVAQLSPGVRSILKRRSDAAAKREYAPVLAADRAAFGSANQRFRGERQSILGATNMAEASLSQALRGLKSAGLNGRYLRQATSELTARRGDVAGAVPFLLSDAAKERGEAIQDARMELISDRASMQQSAATKFNSALDEERNTASSLLKERAEDRARDGGLEFDPRNLKNAQIALKTALENWSENPMVPVTINGEKQMVPFQEANPLKTMEQWREFAAGVSESFDGFDSVDIMEVIKRALRKRESKFAGPYTTQSSVPAIREKTPPAPLLFSSAG